MSNKKKKIIALCSSAAFYKTLLEIEQELKKRGFKVLIPMTARRMQKSGNFEVNQYKTWHHNEADYKIKKHLMDEHFKKIRRSDAILVINLEKNGIKGYVGGNVLMEMALAYFLKQPIYLWNSVNSKHPFMEEIKGMGAIFLKQNYDRIP